MGIARVDIWLADRYRLIAQPVSDVGIPPTDVLCIDVASVFRRCTGWTEHFARQSDEGICLRVLRHIEFLVSMVKPQHQLFIAVDGVPPMAYLQAERQKRGDNTSKKKKFLREHHCQPSDTVFNINKITPGTEFMDRFDCHLAFFVRHKMSMDPDWQAPLVLYSGSSVHGDCKFKIMNYFRSNLRCGADTPSNLTHCIYSIAPDMPLLGLMTHEPHLYILRETDSLVLGHALREPVEKHTQANYSAYHLGLLREYWQRDFLTGPCQSLKLESTLEDFVFLCTLLGNDALPRIPTLHTQEGGVECLLEAYKQVVLEHGYLFEPGGSRQLNQSAVVALFHILGSHQAELGRLMNKLRLAEMKQEGHALMHEESVAILKESGANHDPLELWKDRYYQVKMGYDFRSKATRREVMQSYIDGLIWQAAYYVKGVYCWNYRYSENYGPCMSDMLDFSNLEVDFARVSPLSKNEYLMSVLLGAEKELVPKVLQCLIDNKYAVTKPVYDGCKRLGRDLEGAWSEEDCHYQLKAFPARQFQKVFRRVPWGKVYPDLIKRDREGKILVFKYRRGSRETEHCTSTMPSVFFDVDTPHSMVFEMDGPDLHYQDNYTGFEPCIPAGRRTGRDTPKGFPSFEKSPLMMPDGMIIRIPLDRNCRENFQPYPSTYMFLFPCVQRRWPGAVSKLAEKLKLLKRTVYVCWPYLRKGRVKAIADPFGQQRVEGAKYRSKDEQNELSRRIISLFYYNRGINVRDVDILLTVEIDGRDNLEVDEPIQSVLVKTKNGKLRCVLDYLTYEEKQSQKQIEEDCSDDDLQYDFDEPTPPSSLAPSFASSESGGEPVNLKELNGAATPLAYSDRESQCSDSDSAQPVGRAAQDQFNSNFFNGHRHTMGGNSMGGAAYRDSSTRNTGLIGDQLEAWMQTSYHGAKNDGENSGGSTEDGFDNMEDLDEDDFLRGSQSFECGVLDEEHRDVELDGNPEGDGGMWPNLNEGTVEFEHQGDTTSGDLPKPMNLQGERVQAIQEASMREGVAGASDSLDDDGHDLMYGTLGGVVHLNCAHGCLLPGADEQQGSSIGVSTGASIDFTADGGLQGVRHGEAVGGNSGEAMPVPVDSRDVWSTGVSNNAAVVGSNASRTPEQAEIDLVEVKLTPTASGEEICVHIHHDSNVGVSDSNNAGRLEEGYGGGSVLSLNSDVRAGGEEGVGVAVGGLGEQGEVGALKNMLRASEVADELGVGEATLERITTECFVTAGSEVKNVGFQLSKSPATVEGSWMVSECLQMALEEYQTHHSWLFTALDSDPTADVVSLEAVFPRAHARVRLKMLNAACIWVKNLDTSGFRSEIMVARDETAVSGSESLPGKHSGIGPTTKQSPKATDPSASIAVTADHPEAQAITIGAPVMCIGAAEGRNETPDCQEHADGEFLFGPAGGQVFVAQAQAKSVPVSTPILDCQLRRQGNMGTQSVVSEMSGAKPRAKRLKVGGVSGESCHSGLSGGDQDTGLYEVTSCRQSSLKKSFNDVEPGCCLGSAGPQGSGVQRVPPVLQRGSLGCVEDAPGMPGMVWNKGQRHLAISAESGAHTPLVQRTTSGEKKRVFECDKEVESKWVKPMHTRDSWHVPRGVSVGVNSHLRQFEVASPPDSWKANKHGAEFVAKQTSPEPEFAVGDGKEHWRLQLGDEDKASVGSVLVERGEE